MLIPLVLAITLSLSAAPVAVAWDDDAYRAPYGYTYDPSYGYSSSSSNLEPQRDTWRREEREAFQRQQEHAAEMNRPPVYSEPSYVNPNPSFGVFGADGSYQVCQKGGSTIHCF